MRTDNAPKYQGSVLKPFPFVAAARTRNWCSFATRRDYLAILEFLATRELPPPAEEMILRLQDGLPAAHSGTSRRKSTTLWRWDAVHDESLAIDKVASALPAVDYPRFGPWKQRVAQMILDMQDDPHVVLGEVCFRVDSKRLASTIATLRYLPDESLGRRYMVLNSVFRLSVG